MKMPADVIQRYSNEERGMLFGDGRYHANHRYLVIQKACDLEYEMTELITRFVSIVNSAVSKDRLEELLFGDGRPLGSLKRCADAAYAFGLIAADVQFDLKAVSDMRDRYAHDRERKQLEEDGQMLQKLHKMKLWTSNQDELRNLEAEQAFRCIVGHLAETVRMATLPSVSPCNSAK